MLRLLKTSQLHAAASQSRGLASSLLLSRTEKDWMSETQAQLKKEARARGLTVSGSKAQLARRIANQSQEVEKAALAGNANGQQTAPARSTQAPAQRPFSSSIRYNRGEASVDSESGSDKFVPRRPSTLRIFMPDVREEVEEGPNIPYLPDNYGSNAADSASPTQQPPAPGPKVITVASASTHVAGGPSHNLFEASDAHTVEIGAGAATPEAKPQAKGGFFADLAEDLGLPKLTWNRVAIASNSVSTRSNNAVDGILSDIPSLSAFVAPVKLVKEDSEAPSSSAPVTEKLTPEQRKGLWILLGIVVGGYGAGSVF